MLAVGRGQTVVNLMFVAHGISFRLLHLGQQAADQLFFIQNTLAILRRVRVMDLDANLTDGVLQESHKVILFVSSQRDLSVHHWSGGHKNVPFPSRVLAPAEDVWRRPREKDRRQAPLLIRIFCTDQAATPPESLGRLRELRSGYVFALKRSRNRRWRPVRMTDDSVRICSTACVFAHVGPAAFSEKQVPRSRPR
jgi:hypothetical protein